MRTGNNLGLGNLAQARDRLLSVLNIEGIVHPERWISTQLLEWDVQGPGLHREQAQVGIGAEGSQHSSVGQIET